MAVSKHFELGAVTAEITAVQVLDDGAAFYRFMRDNGEAVSLYVVKDLVNGAKVGDVVTMELGFTKKGGLRVAKFIGREAAKAAAS